MAKLIECLKKFFCGCDLFETEKINKSASKKPQIKIKKDNHEVVKLTQQHCVIDEEDYIHLNQEDFDKIL